MAPSRGRGRSRASDARSKPAKTTRSTRKPKEATPDVYQELLAEEARRSPQDDAAERSLKRRRVAAGVYIPPAEPVSDREDASPAPSAASSVLQRANKGKAPARQLQTIEATSDDDSEFDFEDVDLEHTAGSPASTTHDGIADLSISVDPAAAKPQRTTRPQRKPATNAEKALQILTHKAHVLCLIGHGMYVNTWCNDINVQQHLHSLLSKKTLSYLQGRQDWSQFQNDRAFREALEQASEAFRGHFKVNASGMMQKLRDDRDHDPEDTAPLITRQQLVAAAKDMKGSQDTGNQLFCALLRSAGVEARLVCSIQPVSLSTAQGKAATPQKQKPVKPIIRAMPSYGEPTTDDSTAEDHAVKTSATIGKVPSARRRLGQPSFQSERTVANTVASQAKQRPVRKLDYPVFWVEAFNTAHQKWTAVDPIVTHSIGKPSKFEPPSSYARNQMSYVIAFEDDGVARDVTRRYTKAYNAKTRRNRVESTEGGKAWIQKALRLFRRRAGTLDRDQTEDAELNQREAREGLPGNVQDFKDHPTYALERHLKRHEIIEPKREVGKVNAGTAAKPRMEPVYRRSDVLVCKTGDKWYRLGRIIQKGQFPIKHVRARRDPRDRSNSLGSDEGEGAGMTALYAYHQTEVYVAPPVVNGKVPRNAFGNLDIYVPSMVPPGGTHIRHALAQQAAKSLQVDFADAVTGFKFKGRHGTAIVQGVIVATEHAEAVEAVIEALLDERLEDESLARSTAALRMWKRFLTGLRIKERVDSYGTDGEAADLRAEVDRAIDEQNTIAEAGGFFAADNEAPAMPTAGKFSLVEMARVEKQRRREGKVPAQSSKKRKQESESEEEAISSNTNSDNETATLPTRRSTRARKMVVQDEDEVDQEVDWQAASTDVLPDFADSPIPQSDEAMRSQKDGGGGFLPDDAGGGFLLEEGEAELDPGGGFVQEREVPEIDGGTRRIITDRDTDDAGGGFLPEEGDDGGDGGFIPDIEQDLGRRPDVMSDAAIRSTAFVTRTQDAHPDDAALQMRGALPESGDASTSISGAGDDRNGVVEEVEPGFSVRSSEPATASVPEDVAMADESEPDSDHGSLLSHDPEDDDAEPDWLESD